MLSQIEMNSEFNLKDPNAWQTIIRLRNSEFNPKIQKLNKDFILTILDWIANLKEILIQNLFKRSRFNNSQLDLKFQVAPHSELPSKPEI